MSENAAPKKAKKTPEEVAAARKAMAKAYADLVFPQVLATVLNRFMPRMEEMNEEQQRATRRSVCRTAADISITAGIEFQDKWKQRAGEFLPEGK